MKLALMAGTAALALTAAIGLTSPAEAANAAAATADNHMEDNLLLKEWTGPYGGVPPWDKVDVSMFGPAYEKAIEAYLAETSAIADNPEAPTFENTVVAMEKTGELFSRVGPIFGVHASNLSTPEVREVSKEWSPKLSAAFDKVSLNDKLFQRYKTLYDKRDTLGLNAAQMRLLERDYEGFVRRGSLLDEAGKAKLTEFNQELSKLFTEFSNRVLADEEKITYASDAEMADVPSDVAGAAKTLAEKEGKEGYAIRNTRSMVDPVLTFGSNRGLREKVWREFVSRGDNGDANDTNEVIAKIVKARADRAKLLGYDSHAHWRMQDTMAKTPDRAMDLMMRVWPAAVNRVKEEVAEMMEFASADGLTEIEPWDYLYYLEKVRKAKYDLSQDELKPYFELNNMVNGMMWSAEQLYDLKFTENTGTVPVFHEDIRTFEVTHAKTSQVIGLFYFDTYAREGKRSGAWATTYRSRDRLAGEYIVLGSNNNNFTKPAEGEPVLISLDDAATLWHEFGHAIHYYLTDTPYPSLNGSQRDFVEYPSQVNENWLLSEPVLQKFAVHYQTGERMPQELLDKIKKSSAFGEGYATVSYLSSALVDMALHTDPNGVVDADAFEKKALADIGMPKEIVMRHRLPQFNHLFSSDAYSAGYYSYLWSETMDADTWAAFEEGGNVYDRTIADAFRKHLLTTGIMTDRAEAYKAFRGRDPDVKALLERRGFPTK